MAKLPDQFTRKARDWEVSAIAQVGGAAKLGGGFWTFSFKSPSLQAKEAVFLFAGGVGIKGSLGGASATPASYTKLRCSRDFSLDNLHKSVGRIVGIGGGLAVGYGVVTISASSILPPVSLFEDTFVHGFSVGVGFQSVFFVGVWYCAKLGAPGHSSSIDAYEHSHRC